MRNAISAPNVPMAAILQRSADTNVRDRLRAIIATVVFGLGLASVGVVGAKIYRGMHFWIRGDQAAQQIRSFTYTTYPTSQDLSAVVARASFPVTLPVGLPIGTRITAIAYAPYDHPSALIVNYQGVDPHFKPTFVMLDPTIVNESPLPGPADRSQLGDVYTWNLAREVVLTPKRLFSQADADSLRGAMASSNPEESLVATRPLLWKIIVVSNGGARADLAEKFASANRGEFLLSAVAIAVSSRHQGSPIEENRIVTIANAVNKGRGELRWKDQDVHVEHVTAVTIAGVHAIRAVFAAAKLDQADCKCEALFSEPTPGRYSVWIIPLDGTAARHYLVDASGRSTLAT